MGGRLFDDDGVCLEHVADDCLSLDDSKVVKAVIVKPVDLIRVCLGAIGSEGVARPTQRILAEIVVRKPPAVP